MLELNFYPYSAPIVLTDDLFEEYVGSDLLSVTSVSQRKAAYWLAEIKVSEDIASFLAKTIVTGTYSYNPLISLDHAYVHRVIRTTFIDYEENHYYIITGTANNYVALYDSRYGIVDIANGVGNCGCHQNNAVPYKVEIVYETGLTSGTTYQPDMLLGLATYSKLILNQMAGYGNEAPGDIGIQQFRNQEYQEQRVSLSKTLYGSSPEAQMVRSMINRYRRNKVVALR